jgi:GTPase SAR1 family protein
VTTTLLEARYLTLRGELTGHLGRLCELLAACGRPEGAATARALLEHAAEPFLFVVVGEVKAGKSSLINALLGADVTDVAPDPCTDRIRVIGREETVAKAPSGDLVVRVAVDNPLLDGLAMVDTPGVDSIIDRHQEITEAFIPRADLALFTFSVLNPYSRSAWEFFDLVAGAWGRRVAFALTMADLASREQVAVNTGRLRELARERGVEEPVIFLISSEKSRTDPEAGGIEALRRHIRELTAGGGHFAGKLDATRRSALRLVQELGESLDERGRELAADSAEADRIRSRLDTARLAAGREAEVLRTRVEAAYARLSEAFLAAFAAELTLGGMLGRSVTSLWRRGKDVAGPTKRLAELGEAFGRDLEREVESIAAVGAAHIFESVSSYARILLDELRLRRLASAALGDPLSGERDRVLAEVAGRVETLLAEGGPMAGLDAKSVATMDPRAAMGGALVVLGTIFAVSVKSAVIDVTGGVVAALGALIAGSALYWQRPKVLREMRRRLAHGGETLRQELDDRLSARLDRVFRELADRFEPFFADIAARDEALAHCRTRRDGLEEALRQFPAQ